MDVDAHFVFATRKKQLLRKINFPSCYIFFIIPLSFLSSSHFLITLLSSLFSSHFLTFFQLIPSTHSFYPLLSTTSLLIMSSQVQTLTTFPSTSHHTTFSAALQSYFSPSNLIASSYPTTLSHSQASDSPQKDEPSSTGGHQDEVFSLGFFFV